MARLPVTDRTLSGYLRAADRAAQRQRSSSPFAVALAPGTISGEEWLTPELLNSWVDYGFGYQTIAYAQTADGSVKLRGFTAGGSTALPIFTLTPTYAPAAIEVFAPQAGGGGTARVEILTNGDVVVASYNGTGSNLFLSLSGIRFSPSGEI